MKPTTRTQRDAIKEEVTEICNLAIKSGIETLVGPHQSIHRLDAVCSPALASYVEGFIALFIAAHEEKK